MASPNSTFTELVSTTFRKHKKEFADNVTNNNALLMRLDQKGRKRIEDGGLTIVAELDYAENSTFQRYSGWTKKVMPPLAERLIENCVNSVEALRGNTEPSPV